MISGEEVTLLLSPLSSIQVGDKFFAAGSFSPVMCLAHFTFCKGVLNLDVDSSVAVSNEGLLLLKFKTRIQGRHMITGHKVHR